jgi:hypothetical protein
MRLKNKRCFGNECGQEKLKSVRREDFFPKELWTGKFETL